MKITQEHYDHMKKAINTLNRDNVDTHSKTVKSSGKYKDFSKRMRWDLFYMANLTKFACDTLYDYVNDDHIDTALRSIVKDLNFKF